MAALQKPWKQALLVYLYMGNENAAGSEFALRWSVVKTRAYGTWEHLLDGPNSQLGFSDTPDTW